MGAPAPWEQPPGDTDASVWPGAQGVRCPNSGRAGPPPVPAPQTLLVSRLGEQHRPHHDQGRDGPAREAQVPETLQGGASGGAQREPERGGVEVS